MVTNVATELSIAGAQVLREHFGFTPEQTNEWLRLTTARAKENRVDAETASVR